MVVPGSIPNIIFSTFEDLQNPASQPATSDFSGQSRDMSDQQTPTFAKPKRLRSLDTFRG